MPKIKQSKDVTFNPAEEAENEAVAEVATENVEAEEKVKEDE